MKQKNILVVGGAGYIGTALATRLVLEGYHVTILDNLVHDPEAHALSRVQFILDGWDNTKPKFELRHYKEALYAAWQQSPDQLPQTFTRFEFIRGDTRDYKRLKEVFTQVDFACVFHCGELVGNPVCEAPERKEEVREINEAGTRNVFDLAIINKVPIIYNSTSSLYGLQKTNDKLDEHSSIDPGLDKYNFYKYHAETHLRNSLASEGGYIIIRPATVIGLSPRMRFSVLPHHLLWMALEHKKIALKDRDHYRAFIDIDDLIDAYITILKSDKSLPNDIYNLGGINMSKGDFAQELKAILAASGTVELEEYAWPQGKKQLTGAARRINLDSSKFELDFNFTAASHLTDSLTPIAALLNDGIPWFRPEQKGNLNFSCALFFEMCQIPDFCIPL